jgi:DNA topoisomerase-3
MSEEIPRQYGSLGAYFQRSGDANMDEVVEYQTVKRARPSLGREHEEAGAINSNPVMPLCKCIDPAPAVLKTVLKEGANKGRHFFSCAAPRESSCNLFDWADKGLIPIPTATQSVSHQTQQATNAAGRVGPVCRCSETSALKSVQKEGPNKGKTFWACSRPRESTCNFFEWAATDADHSLSSLPSHLSSAQNPAAGLSGSSCFRCGQTGHWAKGCPSTAAKSDTNGGIHSAGNKCFKCGEAGHYSNNCTNANVKRRY